ncbi:MAG: hypothetical protein J2P37_00305 [Ktedonobacteraceae bacterium]|nr:hypothetical protein [Ktedonobacteraceae bacterium]
MHTFIFIVEWQDDSVTRETIEEVNEACAEVVLHERNAAQSRVKGCYPVTYRLISVR